MLEKAQEIVKNPEAVSTLSDDETLGLLDEVGERFALEPKLIELCSNRAVFVGDTHGDFEATKEVVARYMRPGSTLVFLGDYVDRGPRSLENINYLLLLKSLYPDDLYLLMGNHEAYGAFPFHPADFWEGLGEGLYQGYVEALSRLPLAASAPNGLIALHGALPEVAGLEGINAIVLGSTPWREITWGDWQEVGGGYLGEDIFTGRPQFGVDHFRRMMDVLDKRVLVRSHQPGVPQTMYEGRCLTIFTSSAYSGLVPRRTIAVADLERGVRTAADLVIEAV